MIAKLTDPWFEAEFIGQIGSAGSFRRQDGIEGAQGIFLYSPCSYGIDVGAHGLIVAFANPRNAPAVPANFEPLPRWQMSGSGLGDLTLSPSIDCTSSPGSPAHNLKPGECKPGRQCWHGWIQNGDVT